MNKEELTVVILEDSVEELKKELDKRNRRLERAGVTERFELTVGEPFAVEDFVCNHCGHNRKEI